MATGENKTINGSLTLDDRYQTTIYDDILTISGANISLLDPAGEIFTDKGDDTVTVTNSTITNNSETEAELMFSMGSDNDSLTISNSTLNVDTYMGSGNDTVTVAGSISSEVTINKQFSLGAGDDTLILKSVLSGTGNLVFGDGNDTLIFDGGHLLTTGSITGLTNLTVTGNTGTLGNNLTLAGESINISLNGNFSNTGVRHQIDVSGGTAVLDVMSNVKQTVPFYIHDIYFYQTGNGTLELSGSGNEGAALQIENAVVDINNASIINSYTGVIGTSSTLKLSNGNVSNNRTGISFTGSSISFENVGVSGNGRWSGNGGAILTNVELTANKSIFSANYNSGYTSRSNSRVTSSIPNSIGGAIYHSNGKMDFCSATFSDNFVCDQYNGAIESQGSAMLNIVAQASGGAIYGENVSAHFENSNIVRNYANAESLSTARSYPGNWATGYTTSYATAIARGGAILGNEVVATMSGVTLSGNFATASAETTALVWFGDPHGTALSFAIAEGGAIALYSNSSLSLCDTIFEDNTASANACAIRGKMYSSGAGNFQSGEEVAFAYGGAIYASGSFVDAKNTIFVNNVCEASSDTYGGAIFLIDSQMNYDIGINEKISIHGNKSEHGGFIFLDGHSLLDLDVDGILVIGDSLNNDSFAGTAQSSINKMGSGVLTVNSDISEFSGKWNVVSGKLKLEQIARVINLDNWTIGVDAELHLSALNDTISLGVDKKIGTINLGGGSDTINTNGYHLSGGKLQVSTLTVIGGGKISSDITTRTSGAGFDITLDDVTLASNITGGNAVDKIKITKSSELSGVISLGNGANTISAATGTKTTFSNMFSAGSGNDSLIFHQVNFEKSLDLGSGTNTFTATGEAQFSNIVTGSGNDTFSLQNASFSGSVDLGDGTNTITAVSASFRNGITGESGNDSIKMTADSSISGVVSLGGGKNYVYTSKNLDFSGSFKMDANGETHLIVYNGASLTENALTVYANENDEIVSAYLDWSDIEGLDKVRILVSSDNTFETFEFTVELYNQTKDFTLNLSKGYFIQFQAQDEDGWSQRLLTDTEAPNQVTGFEMNGTTAEWDVVYDNLGGNGVKQYNIQVSTNANFNSLIGTYTATDNSYDFSSFADGNYFIRIQAEDFTGNKGEWSNVENLLIDTLAPSKVTVSCSASKDDITVNWSSASDSASGVKEYNIEFSTTSSFATVSKSATVTGTSFSVADLADGTYYIRVQAVDNVGNKGAWSTVSSAIVDTTAPGVASNVKVTQNSGTVSLSWSSANDSGVGVQKYNIQYSTSSNFNTITGSETVTGTSCNIQNLNDGTYYFRVQAVDKNGNIGSWSSSVSAMVDRTAPTTPVNLSVSTGTYNAVLNWSTASDALSGVKEYEYIISRDSNFNSTTHSGKTTALNKSISDIDYGTYYCKVRAIDNYGNVGEWSSSKSFSIADATNPELTLSADTTLWTNQSVTLSAKAIDAESGIKTIEYSTDNKNWKTGSTVSVNANGTVYFRATDNDGNVTAKSISVTNIDKSAPSIEISGNTATLTNQNVILSVYAQDSASGIKSIIYSFDNRSWLTGSTISVDSNKTVYVKVTDNAGNITEKSIEVNNIDKVAPNKPSAFADVTTATNGNVTISATFSSDSVVKEYSLDNKNWKSYTYGITFEQNGTVYFRGKDEAGNYSAITSYNVNNIDKIAPVKPTVSADITTATNQNVTVSAVFSSDSVVKQYSLDNRTWRSYTSGVVMEDNGTVYFRSQDEAGNYSAITSYNVNNIDKIAPIKPTVSADITTATNQNVTVSAVFSSDSVVKQYSLDNRTWRSYTSGVVMEDNGTVYFRSQDEAGNYSAIASYEVTNIDKVAPAKPSVSADITSATNQNVTVSAVFSSDSVVKQYSLDNRTWQSYTSGVVMEDNGTVYFRGKDEAGNYSTVTSYEVTNIDKVAPTLSISGNATAPTNQDVILTATASDGTVEYWNGSKWLIGSKLTVSENGTYKFRVTDAAGNVTEKSIVVDMIDKVAPTLSISGNATAPTNQNVVLTATASDGTIEYFDNGKWNIGSSLTVTTNGTYKFRVTDAAGNVTEKSVEVTMIDKVAPNKPNAFADITTATNGNVTVSAVFSSDSVVKEYSLDNKNWKSYTFGITFEQNGTVYFRGKDEAGNYSAITSYEVTNIDKVAPTLSISGNATAPTNQGVILTATASDGTVEYWNGSKWLIGSKLTVSENGTYKFRVTDAAGNVTEKSIVVDMIDKVAPTLSISGNATAPTNQNVVLTATASDGTVEYFANGKWNKGNSITATENGIFKFRVTDAAGNVTEKSVTVDMIDKVAPTLSISGNVTVPTNQDVVLTATASDGTIEYFANGKWNKGNSITATENGTYQFRVTDTAGNITEKSVVVDMIDKVAPTLSISGNATAPTNQDVVLIATASDGTIEYFANGKWNKGNSITATENGTFKFRVTDVAGNVSEKSVIVDMIDKVAPTKPSVSADITSATNQNVTVSAVFSSDSVVKQYSLDNRTWQSYTSGVVMENNGTIYFRSQDEAGNYSAITSYEVTNIDKVAPAKPEVFASTTAPTNKNVTVNAEFSLDSIKQQYSLDNQNWYDYDSGIVFNRNGIVYFRGIDAVGNISEVAEYQVSNIDKIAPSAPTAYADITALTNKPVTVNAVFSSDSSRKQYSFDGYTWSSYTSAVVMENNGSVYFRSYDAAGNISDITEYIVENIDKVAPSKPVASADMTSETKDPVTVSAAFSNDSAVKQYSLDNKTWYNYTSGVVMESNGTVYFRGIDAAGNISAVASYEVNNIVAASDIRDNDLDGNGLADVILVHTKQGYSGAWLSTGTSSVIKWGSLSNIKSGTEILGTGKLVGSADDGQDIFFKEGKTVGAWNVVEGKVTGYKTIMNVNATTNVIGLGDFNGDGATDLLLRSTSGDLGFYGTDGTGWEYLIGLGKEWSVAAVGDLNGDGLADTIVRHDAGFAGTFLTQTDGTVKWANLDTLAKDMTIVGTGDFNGDGVDDVLLQKSNGWIGAWLVEDGSVDGFMGICTNKSAIEQIADFNGDGIDDLRVRDGKAVGVLYVNGADSTTWQYFQSVGTEWDTSFSALA